MFRLGVLFVAVLVAVEGAPKHFGGHIKNPPQHHHLASKSDISAKALLAKAAALEEEQDPCFLQLEVLRAAATHTIKVVGAAGAPACAAMCDDLFKQEIANIGQAEQLAVTHANAALDATKLLLPAAEEALKTSKSDRAKAKRELDASRDVDERLRELAEDKQQLEVASGAASKTKRKKATAMAPVLAHFFVDTLEEFDLAKQVADNQRQIAEMTDLKERASDLPRKLAAKQHLEDEATTELNGLKQRVEEQTITLSIKKNVVSRMDKAAAKAKILKKHCTVGYANKNPHDDALVILSGGQGQSVKEADFTYRFDAAKKCEAVSPADIEAKFATTGEINWPQSKDAPIFAGPCSEDQVALKLSQTDPNKPWLMWSGALPCCFSQQALLAFAEKSSGMAVMCMFNGVGEYNAHIATQAWAS